MIISKRAIGSLRLKGATLFLLPLFAACGSSSTSISNNTSDSAADPGPVGPQTHAIAVAEARVYWKGLLAAEKPCENLAVYVARSAKAGDIMTLYENATTAKGNCEYTSAHIDALGPPPHAPMNARAALKHASVTMSNAFYSKAQNFGMMANLANNGIGRVQPSTIVELKRQTAMATLSELTGLAQFADAFKLEGVTMKEYSSEGSLGHRHHHHSG